MSSGLPKVGAAGHFCSMYGQEATGAYGTHQFFSFRAGKLGSPSQSGCVAHHEVGLCYFLRGVAAVKRSSIGSFLEHRNQEFKFANRLEPLTVATRSAVGCVVYNYHQPRSSQLGFKCRLLLSSKESDSDEGGH